MKRSSSKAHNLTRLVLVCSFALSILVLATFTKPLAAGHAKSETEKINMGSAILKNNPTLKSPSALNGKYTLNQYVYPGNATFSSVSPTLNTTSLPISTPWPIGVPILHVITIGNSDPTQTSPVDITLKDTLSGGLASNFVVLNVTCNANTSNSAQCPTTGLPAAGAPLNFSTAHFKIRVGGSNDIVVFILGYYTAQNTYQNTFSVFETSNQIATEEQGPAKNVQINADWSTIDLKLTKTGTSASTSVSTTSPATIHYKLTLTGDSSNDFYPANVIRLQDQLSDGNPPIPGFTISNYTCTSLNGSTCPAAPSPTAPSTSISGASSWAYTYLNWPSVFSSVIKKSDKITIDFDVSVTESSCGNALMSIQNQGAITSMLSGVSYNDSNNGNNYSSTAPISLTTGLQACPTTPVPGTISKNRVCPISGCPAVNWGDTVTYSIVVKNNLTTPQQFMIGDVVSKQSITVPLKASLSPTGQAGDVHCSPSTIVCAPYSSPLPPFTQNVWADNQGYTLFNTTFTLQANGSADDTVTLTFDIQIDKLADCQTDPKNLFDNTATLYLMPGGYSVASTSPVTVKLPDLPQCKLNVTKVLTSSTSGITFGTPVSYSITYENLDSQPITVHTLRDALNMRDTSGSLAYGNVPITNLTASCASTTGVSPMPIYNLASSQLFPSNPDWSGIMVFQEPSSATGITFPANSKLQCIVSFVPHDPSATDNFCQGIGNPEIDNSAFMDVSGLQLWSNSTKPSAPYFAQVADPLPLCRKVLVLKTPLNGVASTGPNGVLTFQIVVTNYGNDPVSNFVLNDPLPAGFTDNGPINCLPTTACQSWNFSGTSPRLLKVVFNPIPGTKLPGQNSVTITFQVKTSMAGGSYTNTATGSFGAGTAGTNFFFEGDPTVLLVNSAQVQVLTPTLSKSFQPGSISVNGTAVLTFNITNQTSNPPQLGISFTDHLPSGVTVVSAPSTACGGSLSASGNSISLSNGSLTSGQGTCQFSVTVKATSCGDFINDQSKFSDVSNLDVTNAHATLSVIGCQTEPTKPTLTKAFDPVQIGPNGTSNLSFTISNSAGDPKQTGIYFSDTLPVGLQIVGVTTNGCSGTPTISSDGRTITLSGGQLIGSNSDGSGKHSCQIVVKVKATGECGLYANTKGNFSDVKNLDVSGAHAQLEVTGCIPTTNSCEASTKEISCLADGSGGYLYLFSVTNNTGHLVTDILLTPPAGSNFTLSQQHFTPTGGLANGASITLQLTIYGGQPGQEACFDVTLMSEKGECCTTRVCPVLPDCCGVVRDDSIECNKDGTYSYTLTIVNTGANTIENVYLYSTGGATMTPGYFPASLKPGDKLTIKVMIKGAKPGKFCFRVSMHTANMKDCCSITHCIVLPDCLPPKG